MKKRLVATFALLAGLWLAWKGYDYYHGLVAGQVASRQLQDSNLAYLGVRYVASIYTGLRILNGAILALLFLIWWKPVVQYAKRSQIIPVLAVLIIGGLSLTGCRKPYREIILIEIEPNQTAFVVPLAGQTSNQAQFASVDYLQDKQVATKRVEIEPVWHKTGHWNWEGEWIPTARVITVDRSPVTREWTQKAEKGTARTDDAFEAETKESIDFSYGGTVSALIREEDAASFLYYFSGKDLATIIDSDIRAFMQGRLAEEFGQLSITQAQEQKGTIFAQICTETEEKFTELGITLTSCGASGGLIYHDAKIQQAITANFEARQAQVRAQAALEAQELENQRVISETIALAEAQRLQGEADAYVLEVRGQALEQYPALVEFTLADSYKGDVPDTYVGSDFPLGMFLKQPE